MNLFDQARSIYEGFQQAGVDVFSISIYPDMKTASVIDATLRDCGGRRVQVFSYTRERLEAMTKGEANE